MVEAVSPSLTVGGRRASFRYVTEASEDGSQSTPNLPQRRSTADVELMIFYEATRDAGELNSVMVSDWEALRDYIVKPSNWNRPTSTIESIALIGGDIIFEYDIAEVEEGGSVLIIRFPCLYTG